MDLNDLALRLVLDWLPLPDVVRCGKVCRRWRALAKDPDFWREKRLKLEIEDSLAVLSFAPCLGELHVDVEDPEVKVRRMNGDGSPNENSAGSADEDEHTSKTYCRQLAKVITNYGIKVSKLKLDYLMSEIDDPVSYLLRAVMAHIVELDLDSITEIYRDDVVRMPKLQKLKIRCKYSDEEYEVSPRMGFTGFLEVLEMPVLRGASRFELIHENAATIQELRVGDVSWDELDVILKLKRLRLLQVSWITGDLPSLLPTPECHIESLEINYWSEHVPAITVRNGYAVLALLSGSVSELTLYTFSNTVFTRLAAMPKLRRLNVQSWAGEEDPFDTVTTWPIAPVEYASRWREKVKNLKSATEAAA